MHSGEMRVLTARGAPSALGEAHGSRFGPMIKDYLSDRLHLAGDAVWSGRTVSADQILTLADSTLDHHEAYSPELFEEMVAMGESAGISPAEAVVVGGFTDLVDVVRNHGDVQVFDECTAVIDPVSKVLAQTWDMHASAGAYVILLDIAPDRHPAALVQTTTGCLGQIGMNEAGIAIGINNLTSMGRVGVTWPFLVRKVLQQLDLDDAIKCIVDARVAGGHNFLILGPDGVGVNIEAMPGSHQVTRIEIDPFVHTNHCIGEVTRLEEGERSQEHIIGSDRRLDLGRRHAGDWDAFFADPDISKRVVDPHTTATCGAVLMKPGERRMQAVWGVPGDQPWETFSL